MSFSTPNTADPAPGPEQKPPIPIVMIYDDPIPRSRSNPTFGTSQHFPNETQADDTFIPGSASMFPHAHRFSVAGTPSFVNGTQNVYYYQPDSRGTRKPVHASRSNERRVDIINKLGEEVKELYQHLQEKTEELSRVEDTVNQQAEKLKRLGKEVGKLNQLLQKKTEELSRVEDTANRQNAKQTEDLKKSSAEVEKLNQLLQEKTDELSRVEDASNRQAERLKRLGEEVGKLNQLLPEKTEELLRVEDTANRQNAKQTEDLKQSNAEVEKLNQLLQGKTDELSRVEDASNRQAEKLKRLEGEVGKLNQLLREKTAELANLEEAANRAEGRHENKVRILKENVSGTIADMNQQKAKYEEVIRGLQGQAYNLVEDMNQLKAKYEKDLQAKIYDQKAHNLDQEPELEKLQKTSQPHISVYGKQTNSPPPQAVVVRADSVSVTEVEDLVKTLNAQIEQTVVLITESLSCLEPPVSNDKIEIAVDELHDHFGPWLYSRLRENSGLDLWITQIFTLQTGLANMCCCIVNDSPFWCNGSIYRHIYKNMAETNQAVADEWRAQTLNYITLAQCEDASKKYLTEIVLRLVTVAVGGVPESSRSLLSQYNQRVEEIARTVAKLHKTITKDVISVELVTYTVSCDTEFDASRMEDTVNMSGSIPHGKVVCTHEMGLLCRKRVEPMKPRGSVKDWDVILKAKVILAARSNGKDSK